MLLIPTVFGGTVDQFVFRTEFSGRGLGAGVLVGSLSKVRKQGRAPPARELDPLQRFVGKENYLWSDLRHAALYELHGYINNALLEKTSIGFEMYSLFVRSTAT